MSRTKVYGSLTLLCVLSGCAGSEQEAVEQSGQLQSEAIVSSVVEGDYVLRSVMTGKCIDIAASTTADGGKVQQWDCNGSNAQKFHISPTSGGYWKIINVNSNKGLEIAGASTAQNAYFQQWSYTGGNHQQFKFVSRAANQFSIQTRHTDMAMDLYWGSADNGTQYVQYPYTGTSNQLYTLDNVSTGGGGTTPPPASSCNLAADGATSLRFINKCTFPITFAGNNITGGNLSAGSSACRTIGSVTDHMITKRYWGFRQGEDPGFEHYSLAEFGFNEAFAGYNSWDWFNLSHVDANNLPLKIIPYELGTTKTCVNQTRSCPMDLITNCPDVGKLRNAAGKVIACVSHDRDNPNSPVAKYFDTGCTQSYSWSGDDSVMAACNAEDFDIVFCPPN